MPIIPLPLPKQSNPGRFPSAGSASLVNCCLEDAGEEGKTSTPRYASAGLRSFASYATGGGVRAMLPTENWLYWVSERLLLRTDPGGSTSAIGGIPTDGLVTMARNRADPAQIAIVSDGLMWVCIDAMLTQNTDVDLPPSSSIAVLDGYGIFPGYGSQWNISDIDDFTSFDGLDFANAESSPDRNLRVAVRESEAVFFGAETVEWWQNTGAEFPFARVQTARIGCLSAASVTNVDRTLAWVAHDGTVRLMEGYGGKRISNHAVERAIADEPIKSALTGTSWYQDGHTYYCLSGTAFSYVFDLTTGLWHQRLSYGLDRWRCAHVVQFAGKTIAGDASTGTLYEMRRDAYDEAGEPLVMEIVAPIAHDFPGRLQINALYLDVLAGQGLVPGDDTTTDPHVMVAMSRDGGATYGAERQISMGVAGDRKRRIVARRWGVVGTSGATFRIRASAAVAKGLLGASIDVAKLGA